MRERISNQEYIRFIEDFDWHPGKFIPDDYSFLYKVDNLRPNIIEIVPEIIGSIDDFVDKLEVGQYEPKITHAKAFGKKHLKQVLKPLNIKYCGIAERNQKISRIIYQIGKRYVLDELDLEYKDNPMAIFFGRGENNHFLVEP